MSIKKITYWEDVTVHDEGAHGCAQEDIPKRTPEWYASWVPHGTCPICKVTASHKETTVDLEENMAPFVRQKSDIDRAI